MAWSDLLHPQPYPGLQPWISARTFTNGEANAASTEDEVQHWYLLKSKSKTGWPQWKGLCGLWWLFWPPRLPGLTPIRMEASGLGLAFQTRTLVFQTSCQTPFLTATRRTAYSTWAGDELWQRQGSCWTPTRLQPQGKQGCSEGMSTHWSPAGRGGRALAHTELKSKWEGIAHLPWGTHDSLPSVSRFELTASNSSVLYAVSHILNRKESVLIANFDSCLLSSLHTVSWKVQLS